MQTKKINGKWHMLSEDYFDGLHWINIDEAVIEINKKIKKE